MNRSEAGRANVYQLIVLPNSGMQICRGFPISGDVMTHPEELWKVAIQSAKKRNGSDLLRLLTEHIACNQAIEASDWMVCAPGEAAFFRLTRTGTDIRLDLVVDTKDARIRSKIPVRVSQPLPLLRRLALRPRPHHLADIYIEDPARAHSETGSLIMDFGNSGSTFIFCRSGAGPLQARITQPASPFDPLYHERPESERTILRSNMTVLRVGQNGEAPWIVLGKRSEELIRDHPLISYLYAPKKYIRHWPEHLKGAEPTMKFRGIYGQRDGFYPMLGFVEHVLDQMLQQVIASLTNPHGTSDTPEIYPQIARIMLTYPLIWRDVDRELFQTLMEKVAARRLVLEERIRSQFRVELICSEPVAVAAYVLWETFFHFGTENLPLAASSLGNLEGTPELRLLVVDIGGGSTDIACVDIRWTVRSDDRSVDVSFKLLESMRFNRAGDRLSHIIATALREFVAQKYGIDEALDFKIESRNPAFTRFYKRKTVSKLSELAEQAKSALSTSAGRWRLEPVDEYELMRSFEPLLHDTPLEERTQQGPHFELEQEVLLGWLEADRQSLETNGEPGFMDIFLYLEELQDCLRADGREPHLAVLSGRSTRLPFIRELMARHLHLPLHRIRTLDKLLPDALSSPKSEDVDKLAVVYGAQRFRFGDQIRFVSLPDTPIFNRYIGTVRETPSGLKLNKVLVRPGDDRPQTIIVRVEPARSLRIGNAFRQEANAQIIAELSNNSSTTEYDVELEILDDYSVNLVTPMENVFLAEWVPGGSDFIVDNFNDTGQIDGEPKGFLKHIVLSNQERWLVD